MLPNSNGVSVEKTEFMGIEFMDFYDTLSSSKRKIIRECFYNVIVEPEGFQTILDADETVIEEVFDIVMQKSILETWGPDHPQYRGTREG